MPFRDETEALRARIRGLERDLQDAERTAEELRARAEEADELRARVRALEAERPASGSSAGPASTEGRRSTARRAARGPVLVGAVIAAAAAGGVAYGIFGEHQPGRAPPTAGPPAYGLVDLDAFPDPPPLDAETRGQHDASAFDDDCRGHVPDAPTVVVRTSEPRELVASTTSSEDLVMVLQAVEGSAVRCDDDSGEGLNPHLSAPLAPGEHRVWIGTYADGASASFTLSLRSRRPGDPPPHLERQASTGSLGTFGPLTAESYSWRGSTSGDIPAERLQAGCRGHLPGPPTALLHLDSPRRVVLSTRSRSDLVLALLDADGRVHCDDDGAGDLQPRLSVPLGAGDHRVWVGTYHASATGDFTLVADPGPESR
ncbi:MAG: hypothetical protein ACFCGT_22150 [Sandaracinaceae bacterium]